MARKKKQEATTEKPFHPEVSSLAVAVMDGRSTGSKAAQKDWVRLVQAQRKREFVPTSLVYEVFKAAGYKGDAHDMLIADAKELGVWVKSERNAGDPLEDFIVDHGTREEIEQQHKALKAELETVAKLLNEYDRNFRLKALTKTKAEGIRRQNKRLFPTGNKSLLEETGIS